MKRRTAPTTHKRARKFQARARTVRPTYRGWNSRSLNAAQRPEWKYSDLTIGGTVIQPINTLYNTYCLPGFITSGPAANQRIAQQITVKTLQLNIRVEQIPTVTALGHHTLVRMMVILDKQSNATALQMGDVLVLNSTNGTICDTESMRRLENRKRFKIMLDKQYCSSSDWQAIIRRKYYLRFKKPLVVQYNAVSGGNYGDVVSNNIYLVFWSSGSAADAPNVNFMSRLRYTDN